MNVLEALIGVIPMQLAATLMGVTPALATVDTQAMDVLAHVSVTYDRCIVSHSFISRIALLKIGGFHQNCHNSDRSYNQLLCLP